MNTFRKLCALFLSLCLLAAVFSPALAVSSEVAAELCDFVGDSLRQDDPAPDAPEQR